MHANEPTEHLDQTEQDQLDSERAGERDAEELAALTLARKIRALPLESQLRLSVMVNEGLPLTLSEATRRLKEVVAGDFKLELEQWCWEKTSTPRLELTWQIYFWDGPDCESLRAKTFGELITAYVSRNAKVETASHDVEL